MNSKRLRLARNVAVLVALAPLAAMAQQGPFKVEALKEAPPADLAGPIKEALDSRGYRIVDGAGKPYADLWLRKAIPAAEKPGGPKGTILFPSLSEGELLGALRYPGEGRDYRDQVIAAGAYTLRYGLQPVNGDHLGASENRDFALLLPAAKDKATADLPQKSLETRSAEAAGSSHPAVLMMLAAPDDAKKGDPAMVNDATKMTWGVVLPLPLAVKGASGATPLHVQLVVVGTAPQ
jgi:hypothetical protein